MERLSKDRYYLEIAKTVLKRSTCLRRRYGAVIVKDDEIIATGYNGSPRGAENCIDCGTCQREIYKVPRGQRYELCKSVHVEANAIISAARRDMIGASLYLAGQDSKTGDHLYDAEPCAMCKRLMINAGIKEIITITKDWKVEEEDNNCICVRSISIVS